MSRSLTNRFADWALANDRAIGVAIGRRDITAAAVDTASPRRLAWARSASLAAGWFTDKPAPAQAAMFGDLLAKLIPEATNRFAHVHVAVPDPLGTAAVFELDSLPTSASLRRQLARWRVAKELGVAEDDIEVDYQHLGDVNGKPLLYCRTMSIGWLRVLKEGFARVGITPWSLNSATTFRFNTHHDRLTKDKVPAALLALDADTWGVSVWDAAGRLRFVRSRWRPAAGQEGADAQHIVEEFERAVLAYVNADPTRSIDTIYISMAEGERASIADVLNRRLQQPCIPLTLDLAGDPPSNARSASIELAILAACA